MHQSFYLNLEFFFLTTKTCLKSLNIHFVLEKKIFNSQQSASQINTKKYGVFLL